MSPIKVLNFYGQNIEVFEAEGEHWVSVSSVCKGMGMTNPSSIHRQTYKILGDPDLRGSHMLTPSEGGAQKTFCVHLDSLNGWLLQINPNKVKAEIKDTVSQYRRECFTAVNNYLFNGMAINPRLADPNWQAERARGKVIRSDATDVIKQFIDYAHGQGSENAHHYYRNITRAVYRGLELIESYHDECRGIRETLETKDLAKVGAAETLVQDVLAKGMAEDIPYRDIYAAARDAVVDFAGLFSREIMWGGKSG